MLIADRRKIRRVISPLVQHGSIESRNDLRDTPRRSLRQLAQKRRNPGRARKSQLVLFSLVLLLRKRGGTTQEQRVRERAGRGSGNSGRKQWGEGTLKVRDQDGEEAELNLTAFSPDPETLGRSTTS